jgi:ParB/RepB/Spo0J family partition protein
MSTAIQHVAMDRLVPHPDNPNRMSRGNLDKLVRNIERSGRYEPLVVRPCPGRQGFFQVLNGHRRCEALRRLGHTRVEALVWDVDDEQADILLATLNRLGGRDILENKLTLLRRLRSRIPARKLARLLPQTFGQIERLTASKPLSQATARKARAFANPMVFFVDDGQQRRIEEALSAADGLPDAGSRAARRAAALTQIAAQFLARPGDEPEGREL